MKITLNKLFFYQSLISPMPFCWDNFVRDCNLPPETTEIELEISSVKGFKNIYLPAPKPKRVEV